MPLFLFFIYINMLCLKGKMIGVTTFEESNSGKKIEIIFKNYNRPPLNTEMFVSLEVKNGWYLLNDYVIFTGQRV